MTIRAAGTVPLGLLGLCLALEAVQSRAAGPAGIKLDGTLGPSAAALAGPMYAITQNLGKLSGGNLYFSFQYFNVATGETALFTTTSAGISNVISRVTGGYASTIDGTIQLQAASGAPNFFLINPSGVTFTANAVIDVPAAFYVSTANYLKFSDGNFYVDPGKMSTLSAAAPEAFGFLGTTRAPVTIEGANLSAGVNGAGDFQIAAGDVTIDGGGSSAGIFNTTGSIRVIAIGSQVSEVPIGGAFDSNDGTVTIQNDGFIGTQGGTGTAAGAIYLSTGSLAIDGTNAASQTGLSSIAGDYGAGPVAVNVGGTVKLTNGGGIYSDSPAGSAGASITLNAGDLIIQGTNANYQTGIQSENDASGTGGAVTVTARSLVLDGVGAAFGDPFVGIGSFANTAASGATGAVTVNVSGPVSISNGAVIYAQGFGAGNGGVISVTAKSLSIDGTITGLETGISGDTQPGSTGNGGDVTVTSVGALTMTNGGSISAYPLGTGNAGTVAVTAGAISISSAALITASTFGSGNAGSVLVTARSISIDGAGAQSATGIASQVNSGSIVSTGSAGDVSVTTTGPLTLSNGAQIDADSYGAGNAGNVTVNAGALKLTTGSSISSSTSSANAGEVNVMAQSINIDGGNESAFTGIVSQANGTTGAGGKVIVTTPAALNITNAGSITSGTFGSGNGGDVSVKAGSIFIDGITAPSFFTGISSQANQGSTGSAGIVTVSTAGATSISGGGAISSGALGTGNGGDVSVTAGSVAVTGDGLITTSTFGNGNAGNVTVSTGGALTISNGGDVSSSTFGSGNGGDVYVSAISITINGNKTSGFTGITAQSNSGTGSAGKVSVRATGTLTITGEGEISTETFDSGSGGNISVNSGSMAIIGDSGPYATGIFCDAGADSTGPAGNVAVATPGSLTITNGGEISSNTEGSGAAGKVSISTPGILTITGGSSRSEVSSLASSGSSGQPGTIAISAGTLILGTGGEVTIENDATVSNPSVINPTQISIQARNVQMDGGLITAASTGNAAASGIDISYDSALRMDPSTISTSAVDGDGGPITITGHGPLIINHSNITTSVTGKTNGNGGDITIIVPEIVLDTGAIQANTTAPLASGGTVTIEAQVLVPSFQSFILGGSAVAFDPAAIGLNVVQAVAPDGVSGVLSVTVPTLDLGNALLGLTGKPSAPVTLGRDLCGSTRASSLAVAGRGGVAPTAYDPLWTAAHMAGDPAAAPASGGIHPLELFACR